MTAHIRRKLVSPALSESLPKEDQPSVGERRVAEAASHLSDGWHVWHRLPFTSQFRGVETSGDHDVLFYHRQYGFVTMEIKAGGVHRNSDGWYSQGSIKLSKIKDPVAQSQKCMRALVDQIASELGEWRRIPAPAKPRAIWVVCFPNLESYQPVKGADLPENHICLGSQIANLEEFLLTATSAISVDKTEHSPTDSSTEQQIFRFLDGNNSSMPLTQVVVSNDRDIEALTAAQLRDLDAASRNKCLCIEGSAGSGKSVLARAMSKDLQGKGNRVLLLCMSRLLATENAVILEGSGVEARTIHDLALDLHKKSGGFVMIPTSAAEQDDFWNIQVLMWMSEAIPKMPARRYDAIIVDEAQDVGEDWWPLLMAILADSETGLVRLFRDTKQRLAPGPVSVPGFPSGVSFYNLSKGVRSSRLIYQWIARRTKFEIVALDGVPQGRPPEVLHYVEKSEQCQMLDNEIAKLHAEGFKYNKILVVSCERELKGGLGQYKGRKAAWSLTNSELDHDKVNIVSVFRSKGLEADAVILVDVEPECEPERIYVGASRAKHSLTVFERGAGATNSNSLEVGFIPVVLAPGSGLGESADGN